MGGQTQTTHTRKWLIYCGQVLGPASLFALALWIGGCVRIPLNDNYPEVVRVYKHGPSSYGFQTQDPKTKELIDHNYPENRVVYTTIYADVPVDKPMWARVSENPDPWHLMMEIHVHDPKEVNGVE